MDSVVGRTGKALFLGQVASFLQALAGFNTSLLASLGVDVPITQSFFCYLALALVYGSILLHRRRKLQIPWHWYLLLGFLDFQANFLLNKSYQFSSITSITLLLCWTVPWVIILTWIALGARYSILQLVGAALCVAGLALVLFSDAWSDSGGGGSMPLLGDTLVLVATIFFAFANVGEEFAIRNGDRVELLAMFGIFGLSFSLVEMLPMAGYVVSAFCSASAIPYILEYSGATMLNLSCLTSNMWAVVIRIFFYRQKMDRLYFLAVAIVVVGLVIYSTKGNDSVSITSCEEGVNPSSEFQQLQGDEENTDSRGV